MSEYERFVKIEDVDPEAVELIADELCHGRGGQTGFYIMAAGMNGNARKASNDLSVCRERYKDHNKTYREANGKEPDDTMTSDQITDAHVKELQDAIQFGYPALFKSLIGVFNETHTATGLNAIHDYFVTFRCIYNPDNVRHNKCHGCPYFQEFGAFYATNNVCEDTETTGGIINPIEVMSAEQIAAESAETEALMNALRFDSPKLFGDLLYMFKTYGIGGLKNANTYVNDFCEIYGHNGYGSHCSKCACYIQHTKI